MEDILKDRTERLGNHRISSLLLQFSIPAIVGMVVNSLYNIIDRIFVGRFVGTDALSGIAITMPIAFILMGFGMLIGIGAGTLVSIRLGEGKHDQAQKILNNAVLLYLIVGISVPIICLLNLDWLLMSFGASKSILPYAKSFITIILLGSIFQHFSFGLSSVMRSEGSPRIAMMTQLINALLNIILDYIFICLLHGGVKASALATVISWCVSSTWVLLFFRSKKSTLHIRLRSLRLDATITKAIFAIGFSGFAMQLAGSFINIIFNRGLSHYGGDIAIGAFAIINSVVMLILMPVLGIMQGAQPIIGYNYGAKKYSRVKKTVMEAAVISSAVTFIGWIVVQLFPEYLLKIFTTDIALIDMAKDGLKIYTAFLFIVGAQILLSNFFQAIGKALESLILTMSRQVLILIPLLLIFPKFWGLKGIWWSMPTSDMLAFMITLCFFFIELRNMRKFSSQGSIN